MTDNAPAQPTRLPHDDVDPGGLLEYSVVFTDRSLNHMSKRFTGVMQDIIRILKSAYDADAVAIVPGGGSYAMEAVARQLMTDKKVLIQRNGLFSFRWSQILEAGKIAAATEVLKAAPVSDDPHAGWAPTPVDQVVAAIEAGRPDVVIATHVETAAGIILPDDYIRALAQAAHAAGGLFVLDCVASGATWASMRELGVDVLISAPQKGWSGSPCAGYVMLSEAGRAAVESSESSSFAIDLKKWLSIADSYVSGGTPYHATMPTDSLAHNAELMLEAERFGLDKLAAAQAELGERVRGVCKARGIDSVAADDFAAPSVVVAYASGLPVDAAEVQSGAAFKKVGLQIASGVPLQCDEGPDFASFRLGLFGLDKLGDIDGTVRRLEDALDGLGLTAS
ncbi:aminotransferase class V-fold PLP-dependent enzyme [Brevibacterium sp. 50QC2O2]|uniref:aminotransferase class V-fold PLP-dependent enzyme n=1 Tax=unclassified Brevibacterium TaxID=2614124 RepID=UPI00211C8C05|nr:MULTISPECIES: aminotransferase class V-fold PLP-dependent enzyme [unclassified Brevibacterium]MCQ9368883.1 aminotransferase class V-fold PLP-dependent enzyme [Brevibacterium sp. 91QC2O2]MCQ9388451.1 aminotransferase class V-fold PLP-dependent enzyme [Brevibacterium sp. 50QC2O2]